MKCKSTKEDYQGKVKNLYMESKNSINKNYNIDVSFVISHFFIFKQYKYK